MIVLSFYGFHQPPHRGVDSLTAAKAHIHVDAVGSAAFRFGHLLAQPGEIGRED
jgi:hypothetical protein